MEVWHHLGLSTTGKSSEHKPRPGLRGAVGSNVSAWGDNGLQPTKQLPEIKCPDDYLPSAVDVWATECRVLSDDGKGKNKNARVSFASNEVSGVIGARVGAGRAGRPPRRRSRRRKIADSVGTEPHVTAAPNSAGADEAPHVPQVEQAPAGTEPDA